MSTGLGRGSYISQVLLGRGLRGDVTRVTGVESLKVGGHELHDPHPQESGPKNAIMIECMQESGLSPSCTF